MAKLIELDSIGMRLLRAIVPLALKFSPSSPDPHVPPSSIEYYTCKGRKRKIHVYLPKPAIEGPLPIYISLHGAGFCLESVFLSLYAYLLMIEAAHLEAMATFVPESPMKSGVS